MKVLSIILFFLMLSIELKAQNCNPQTHVDYLKKKAKAKVVQEFLLNFKKDSVITFKRTLKAGKYYVIDFGTKGKSNQGICLSILRNGTYIKRGIIGADADFQFPAKLPIRSNGIYTITFSYLKDYIQDYCAGAILIEY